MQEKRYSLVIYLSAQYESAEKTGYYGNRISCTIVIFSSDFFSSSSVAYCQGLSSMYPVYYKNDFLYEYWYLIDYMSKCPKNT